MIFPQHIVQNKRSLVTIMVSSIILGLLYPIFARDITDWAAFVGGFLIGTIGGIIIVIFELHLFYIVSKSFSFSTTLFAKVFIYTVIFNIVILGVITLIRSLEKGEAYFSYIQSDLFLNFLKHGDYNIIVLYTVSMVLLIVTTRQVSRKMGQGVLFNFIIGKYRKPKNEPRIFLYLDLLGSTAIAEKLGNLRYHEFLKRYFFDLTGCIAKHSGEIYRYVGDQVAISWISKNTKQNTEAINCFLCAKQALKEKADYYLDQYGFAPEFRGALDSGEVLTGEIGEVKSQIIFYGEVLLRTSLIENKCKKDGMDHLVSENIYEAIKGEANFNFTYHDKLVLEDLKTISLYKVTKK